MALQLPPRLIKCKRHGIVPWDIICDHLLYPKTAYTPGLVPVAIPLQWHGVTVKDGRECELDWFCKDCLESVLKEGQIDNAAISAVCMFCSREIRGQHV